MLSDYRLSILLGLFVAILLPPSLAHAEDTKNPPAKDAHCKECLRVRVGVPRVARGPAPNIADNPFTEIQLPNGKFRGFTANGNTFAVDGDHPYDMGAERLRFVSQSNLHPNRIKTR